MVLRTNVHQNNISVIRQQLPALSEKTGPICLLRVGLTAGHKAGRKNVVV